MAKFIFSAFFIFLFALHDVVSGTVGEELVDLINAWRRQNGKSSIPESTKLYKVAKAHTENQCVSSYKGRKQKCWNPHSWEAVDGFRYSCCYEPKQGSTFDCMWDKPSEIVGWDVEGFEVSAGGTSPSSALSAWKRSSGHTDVILSQGKWKYKTWKAIGCAGAPDRLRHWNCWFASERDYSSGYVGEPNDCDGSHWGNIWGFTVDEEDVPAINDEGNDEMKGKESTTRIVWIVCSALLLVIVSGVIIYLCLKKRRTEKGVKVQDEEDEDDAVECEVDGDEAEETVPVTVTAE